VGIDDVGEAAMEAGAVVYSVISLLMFAIGRSLRVVL